MARSRSLSTCRARGRQPDHHRATGRESCTTSTRCRSTTSGHAGSHHSTSLAFDHSAPSNDTPRNRTRPTSRESQWRHQLPRFDTVQDQTVHPGVSVPGTLKRVIVGTSARFVLRHRWWVIRILARRLVAGGWAAGRVPDRLSYDFSLPVQEVPRPPTSWPPPTCPHRSRPIFRPDIPAGGDQAGHEHRRPPGRCHGGRRPAPRTAGSRSSTTAAPATRNSSPRRAQHFPARLRAATAPASPTRWPRRSTTPPYRRSAAQLRRRHHRLQPALGRQRRQRLGPSVLVETLFGALGALIVLIFVFGLVPGPGPAPDRGRVDPVDVPSRPRPHNVHRRFVRRSIPDRADRARRRDRLLAAGCLALA